MLASYGWAYVSSFTPIPTIGPNNVSLNSSIWTRMHDKISLIIRI